MGASLSRKTELGRCGDRLPGDRAFLYIRVRRGHGSGQPGSQRRLRATVGATVQGATGRGQSSRQTVTFSGRLSCNTFSGRRKEVEAFVLNRPATPGEDHGGPSGLVRDPAQCAGPSDFSWIAVAVVVFVRLAAQAAWSLCVRVKPQAHRRAPWASAGEK